MKRIFIIAGLLLCAVLAHADVAVRGITYDVKLGDNDARFTAELDLEVTGKEPVTLPLFEGELAVLATKLPDGMTLQRTGKSFALTLTKDGRQKVKLEFVAKITRTEPWNQINFTGPTAVIAEVTAQTAGEGMELQLLKGTVMESVAKNGLTKVRGFLGSERVVSLRWQSKATEVARKALLTCDTAVNVAITPTVVKYTTHLKYDIVQGQVARLLVSLPTNQALTKLQGDGVRDWAVKSDGTNQVLRVELVRPVERNYALSLFSEQTVESATASVPVAPPQPQEVEREAGALTVTAEDVLVETESVSGLRQVNAAAGALAAYQFYSRPFALTLKLRRIEPVVNVADRVTVRLEESRLLATHLVALNIEKAGIYALELQPQAGFVVADVRGEGVEDWKSQAGKLLVNFNRRVLGSYRLEVQLEQALRGDASSKAQTFVLAPLRVPMAAKETAVIGAAAAPGIQLKTAADGLTGLREMPINRLPQHRDEVLAYQAEQSAWKLTLAAERLAARITAEVFNLITIGDGIVGGSATIRYAILNQGVQEFQVKLPAHWRNVEFTGPNIRRKEQHGDTWTIALQEKAWSGYTLVVTYDFQFPPHGATLPVGGAHAVGVERETGSIAVTSAANLQIREGKKDVKTQDAAPAEATIRRVDESELAVNDRALISRPVLLAYMYAGPAYELTAEIVRFNELPILEAVADRTQLTTVLTDGGQLLTQASFMVKNNDKQFQTFTLPSGADFWSCYVRGEPAKPERTGNKLLVPLPRGVNRDEAFAVDIVYAQRMNSLKSAWSDIALAAPVTDVQTTYAEWELFVPQTHRLASFGGNMIVARGTTYGLKDAWQEFERKLTRQLRRNAGPVIALVFGGLVILGLVAAHRRGFKVILGAIGTFVALLVLAGMLLPATQKARERARSVQTAMNERRDSEPLASLPRPSVSADVDEGGVALRVSGDGTHYGSGSTAPSKAIGASGGGGGAGIGGSINFLPAADGAMVAPGEMLPVVAGIRPIRIEIPKTGARFVFTKVLNVRGDSLTLRATAMEDKLYKALRGTAQAAAFALGLALLVWQAWRRNWSSFKAALGVALAVGGLVGFLLSYRLLDEALLLSLPVAGLVIFVMVLIALWKRIPPKKKSDEPPGMPPLMPPPITPGAQEAQHGYRNPRVDASSSTVTGLMLALLLGASAQAADKPAKALSAEKPVPAMTAVQAPTVVDCLPAIEQATVVSAQYTGVVRELGQNTLGVGQTAQFEATFELKATTTNQVVRLFGDEVAVQEFSGPKGRTSGWFGRKTTTEARLLRTPGAVSVLLPEKGTATVRVKFLVKLGGDVAKRRIEFGIPAALMTKVAVTLDEAEAMVELPTAVSFKTVPDGQKTRVESVMGAAERVELTWTARTKRAAEIAATVFCQNASLVSLGGGVLNVRSVLDYNVTQGELRQMKVRLPAGQRLMRVEGEAIRTWKLEDQGKMLVVELVKGVSPSYRLTVETERPLEAGAELATIEIPHAVEVKRETGLLALKASDELSVAVDQAGELQKVDIEEFARAMSQAKTAVAGMSSAYRFLKSEFALTVRVAPVQPQIEAVVRNVARLSAEQIGITAHVEYTIKRTGVFVLQLALPAGYRVERVTGQNIAQWVEKDGQLLEVTLKQRTMGAYALQVDLARTLPELPPKMEIVGVQPLGVEKLSGFVSVASEEGLQIKTETFGGLSEVPATAVGLSAGSGVLAFKMIPADTTAALPGWKLAVSSEKIESWVRAEVMNWVTLSETLVSGRTLVRYEIQNAPTKEFRIKAPAALRNVEVTGANIRRQDQTGNEWRVELQNKVRGSYLLVVTWERPWNVKEGTLDLPGIEVPGVERETGWLAVNAPASLRVELREETADLLKTDAREVPDWAGRGDQQPTLTYRYLRAGYKLALATQRFEEAEVLQALVDNVNLTTVVSEDGQMMTEMKLAIRNNARQYLEVTLPPQATNVWSAFVGGQPVRPSVREGKLLLPMERSGADGAPVQVELTYVSADKFPKRRGTVKLETPALDIPLKNARWELFLPPDYTYSKFEGSMKHDLAVVAQALANPNVFFSFQDYAQVEGDNRAKRFKESASSMSAARSNIVGGKLNDAVRALGNLKNNWNEDDNGAKREEVKKLEKDIRRAQGKQMIEQQRQYIYNNTVTANGSPVVIQNGGIGQSSGTGEMRADNQMSQQAIQVQFDEVAAEQQAEKVQKAQEIVTVKAMPLRVNLPRRGQQLSFTQTLQTEIRKPMSVEFAAVESKGVGMLTVTGLSVAGFGLLWGLLALLMRRRVS